MCSAHENLALVRDGFKGDAVSASETQNSGLLGAVGVQGGIGVGLGNVSWTEKGSCASLCSPLY